MFSSSCLSVLLLTLLSHLISAAPTPKSKLSPSLGVSCKTTADCRDGLVCNTASYTCTYSAVVRQASGRVPDGWICNRNWYSANDGCDCGCGVTDPDCNKEDQSLFCQNSDRSPEDSRCDLRSNICVAKPPDEWTCTENWYDTSDGCDCGCGAIDPDCNKEAQSLYCPNSNRLPRESRCDLNRNICVAKPPDEWTCTENWYDTSDGCDCGCGATDPDCNKEDQSLYCLNSPLSGSESRCDLRSNKCVPKEWTCSTSWYDADDGCDCGCGATDPDCKKDDMTLYCHNRGRFPRILTRCNLKTNKCEIRRIPIPSGPIRTIAPRVTLPPETPSNPIPPRVFLPPRAPTKPVSPRGRRPRFARARTPRGTPPSK